MAYINVLAGDFKKGKMFFLFGKITLITENPPKVEQVAAADLDAVEPASEESVKKLGGTVGWGVVGATVFGPAGLLAGLLLGGKKTEVTFVARLKDGRKFLASTDSKTFSALRAAAF